MTPRASTLNLGLAAILLALGLNAAAQSTPASASDAAQVLTLSASARQEVQQDWLSVVVRAQIEGNDPAALQTQLKSVTERALASLRPQLQPQQLEVRSGSFGIYPRHNNEGRRIGWQGQTELVIEGRDFAQVAKLAGNLPQMTVSQTGFSLSPDGRQQLEAQVQSQAVQRFRQRAQALATDFGFAGYTLRQVTVGSVDRPDVAPQSRMLMAAPAVADASASIPLAAGKEEVRVTVSGSIALR